MSATAHVNQAPRDRPTTRAAEGFSRWRWTLAEFERLVDLGVLGKSDRVELIDGELVPMAAKGIKHEFVRHVLLNWIIGRLPKGLSLGSEPGWRPGGDTYAEPDLFIFPDTFDAPTVPPTEVLLLVEVARSSLKFDREVKARLYASLGVREYWVVDVRRLVTHMHRDPGEGGCATLTDVGRKKQAVPRQVPELAICFGDLVPQWKPRASGMRTQRNPPRGETALARFAKHS
jgi:Uma2 family endonuclease